MEVDVKMSVTDLFIMVGMVNIKISKDVDPGMAIVSPQTAAMLARIMPIMNGDSNGRDTEGNADTPRGDEAQTVQGHGGVPDDRGGSESGC